MAGTYWTNPAYRIKVVDRDEDEDDDVCTLVVGLMQCGRRGLPQQGNLTIGYDIFEVQSTFTHKPFTLFLQSIFTFFIQGYCDLFLKALC